MSGVAVLEREIYTVAQASRLLRVPPSTLHWWLEGGTRGGRPYEPVLRATPTGSSMMTWGEFVEAGYLREYRRRLGVSLQHLRRFIELLRTKMNVRYPLAHHKPFVAAGAQLVIEAQQMAGLKSDLWLFVPVTGQILLPSVSTVAFLDKAEFSAEEGEWVERLHPLGVKSPVVFDPDHSFGEPTVRGIRTEVLAELVEAGEPVEDVARDYQLDVAEVKAAVGYEFTAAAA